MPMVRDRRFVGLALSSLALALVISACTDEGSGGSVSLPPTTLGSTTTSAPPSTDTTPPSAGSRILISPLDDGSEIVMAAPEGTSFEFLPGVHRGFSVKPKDGMTFVGRDGAVVSGAIELSRPAVTDTGWRFDGIEQTGAEHGDCIDGYDGCRFSQDLFYDDVMLWQVTDIGELTPGTWYWGDDGIHVADDPANRRVELSVAPYAFRSAADDVTISRLVVEKYANAAQLGAVQAQQPGDGDRGRRWLIEDVEVRGVHGAGVRTGDATTVRRLYSHHNGQMGITVSGGTDVVLEDSELAFNNRAGFQWGWEAGGSKFSNTNGLIVRNNRVHDNVGPGLWTDIDNVDTLYEGNVVEDNDGPGIFHEISGAAIIRGNTVTGNGFDFTRGVWGSGILIAASSHVEIADNVVRGNADGIGGLQQDRGEGRYGAHLLDHLWVHGNIIDLGSGQMGIVEETADPSVFERDFRFEGNVYPDFRGRPYQWMGASLDRQGWVAAGFDVNGEWP